MSQEIIERTFTVSAPARLKLANIRGTVTIKGDAEGQVIVSAVKHTGSGDASHTEVLLSQEEGGRVVVETKYQDWFLSIFNFSKPCKVDYDVHVPANCELEVSVVSSSLSIQGVNGNLKSSTVSGDVTLNNLKGELTLSSVSGNITGDQLFGAIKINTVSGDVHLRNGDYSQAKVTSVSGNIHLDTASARGPYTFQSVSGNAFLVVSEKAGFSVSMHTVSGALRTHLPIQRQQKSAGWLTAEVNGGGVEVTFKSVSGDLHLEGVEIPVSEIPIEPGQLSRRQVLERIERGEMTVEEGLSHLR